MNDDKIIQGLNDNESIADMRRRQAKLGFEMQRVGAIALAELEKKAKAGALDAEDAKTLSQAGIEMERAALGQAPDDDDAPAPKVTH